MRLSIVFAIAATSVAAASTLPAPVAAMELREAIKRCDASPGCTYTLDKSGATIFGPKGGVVSCPPKQGACEVIGKTKGGKPGPGTVTGVMSGSIKSEGKTPTTTATGPVAGKEPIEKKPVAASNVGRAQGESHQSSTGFGSGSTKR